MLSTIIRGWLHSAAVETTLLHATLALFAFATIGWVIGHVAQTIIDDSVRGKIAAQLAAQDATEANTSSTP